MSFGIEPYQPWNPTRRQRVESRVVLNPCEPCAASGKKRTAKCVVRLEDGELQDVCMCHYLELTDAMRDED